MFHVWVNCFWAQLISSIQYAWLLIKINDIAPTIKLKVKIIIQIFFIFIILLIKKLYWYSIVVFLKNASYFYVSLYVYMYILFKLFDFSIHLLFDVFFFEDLFFFYFFIKFSKSDFEFDKSSFCDIYFEREEHHPWFIKCCCNFSNFSFGQQDFARCFWEIRWG